MRQHFDNVNGVAALLFTVYSFVRGHLSEMATGAALIYSLMLIGEKLVNWSRNRKLKTDASDSAGA